MARTNKPGTQAPTDGIKVTERSLDSYAFDPANANKGKPRGQKMIEDSIRELGTGRSVLADADDVLIAGNHALEAARSVGITRAVEHGDSLHGVISIVKTSDTSALIEYDVGLTNLSNLNHVLNKYRITQQESKRNEG